VRCVRLEDVSSFQRLKVGNQNRRGNNGLNSRDSESAENRTSAVSADIDHVSLLQSERVLISAEESGIP